MRYLFRGLLMILIATAGFVGPSGCSKNEEPTNPELKVPEIPPVSSKDGKKMPDKGKKKA